MDFWFYFTSSKEILYQTNTDGNFYQQIEAFIVNQWF